MLLDFVIKNKGFFTIAALFSVIGMASAAGSSLIMVRAVNSLNQNSFTKFIQLNLLWFLVAIISDSTSYFFGVYAEKMVMSRLTGYIFVGGGIAILISLFFGAVVAGFVLLVTIVVWLISTIAIVGKTSGKKPK